jgi:hypothetical protein
MAAISAFQANELHLMALRPGHWVIYAGTEWQVNDYSTYTDPQGYQLCEWELTAPRSGNTYYLLRELETGDSVQHADRAALRTPSGLGALPFNSGDLSRSRAIDPESAAVCWYMAKPVNTAKIFLPDSGAPITSLWAHVRWGDQPPEALMVYGKTYYYDSQTRGAYSAEGEATGDRVERVTWDYWDADHRGNLAIETWPDGRLELYISQVIDPQSVVVQPRGLQMPIALNRTAAIATVDSPAIAEPNTTAAPAVDPSDASLQASVLAQPGISAAAIAMQSLNRAKEAAIDRELAWQLMMGAIVKIILGLIMLSLGFIVLFVP